MRLNTGVVFPILLGRNDPGGIAKLDSHFPRGAAPGAQNILDSLQEPALALGNL